MNRKMMIFVTTAMMAVSMAACGHTDNSGNTASTNVSDGSSISDSSTNDMEQLEGGWEIPDSPELTSESREALTKATEGLSGAGYTPVALLGTQVVSGTNYKILCREIHGTNSDSETWSIITVYEDLEGSCKITETEDSGNPTDISDEENITGGWEQADSPVITDDEKEAFDKAFGDADSGYEISPVAILSQQVVAGKNYCFLATKDSDGSYVFAYFYEDLGGNVSNAYTVDFNTKADAGNVSACMEAMAKHFGEFPDSKREKGTFDTHIIG